MSDQQLSDYDLIARDARRAVATAVREGHLERQPCEECGAPAEAHHHMGYDSEHWLDVIWLCRRHHAARHFDMHRKWSAVVAEKRGTFRLRDLRLARGMSQAELAQAMGISQSNISALESREDALLSTVRAYVEALGGHLTVEAVFGEERIGVRTTAVEISTA